MAAPVLKVAGFVEREPADGKRVDIEVVHRRAAAASRVKPQFRLHIVNDVTYILAMNDRNAGPHMNGTHWCSIRDDFFDIEDDSSGHREQVRGRDTKQCDAGLDWCSGACYRGKWMRLPMKSPSWPENLADVGNVLEFLGRSSTPALSTCKFNGDFLPPVFGSYAYDESAYTDLLGQPYYGADADDQTKCAFTKQLHLLAQAVKWDDDLDCDASRDVRVTPCTDADRVKGSGGTWIELHISHAGAEFTTVYTAGKGTSNLDEAVPTDYKTYPLRKGDWVLSTATLHRRDDAVWDRREYELLARHLRILRFHEPEPKPVSATMPAEVACMGSQSDTGADAEGPPVEPGTAGVSLPSVLASSIVGGSVNAAAVELEHASGNSDEGTLSELSDHSPVVVPSKRLSRLTRSAKSSPCAPVHRMDAEMAFYITDPVRILDIEQQIVSRKPAYTKFYRALLLATGVSGPSIVSVPVNHSEAVGARGLDFQPWLGLSSTPGRMTPEARLMSIVQEGPGKSSSAVEGTMLLLSFDQGDAQDHPMNAAVKVMFGDDAALWRGNILILATDARGESFVDMGPSNFDLAVDCAVSSLIGCCRSVKSSPSTTLDTYGNPVRSHPMRSIHGTNVRKRAVRTVAAHYQHIPLPDSAVREVSGNLLVHWMVDIGPAHRIVLVSDEDSESTVCSVVQVHVQIEIGSIGERVVRVQRGSGSVCDGYVDIRGAFLPGGKKQCADDFCTDLKSDESHMTMKMGRKPANYCTTMEADDSLPYLAHCDYSEDFFLGPEQANPDGCSYYRSYLDDNGDPFLSCVIGRVRDILPISTSRQILVLGKPPVSPELRQLFHESCAVADDVMATDRVQGRRHSCTCLNSLTVAKGQLISIGATVVCGHGRRYKTYVPRSPVTLRSNGKRICLESWGPNVDKYMHSHVNLDAVHHNVMNQTVAQPGKTFFLDNVRNDASNLIGHYAFGQSFDFLARPNPAHANRFVYSLHDSAATALRANILGRVVSMYSVSVDVDEVSPRPRLCSGPTAITRYNIVCLDPEATRPRAYFDLDIEVLTSVVLSESVEVQNNRDPIADSQYQTAPWYFRFLGASLGRRRYDLCRQQSFHYGTVYTICRSIPDHMKIINRAPAIGDIIRADVSLHRNDFRTEIGLTRAYFLIAHDLEPISTHYLQDWGFISAANTLLGGTAGDAQVDLGICALVIEN
ncbi:hypothetical protein B0H13DRAFT_1882461 [Mycena leptocephala]|nr:hypothetical protein B0H13DRAFT_1882461 [Mycena leptocephala]